MLASYEENEEGHLRDPRFHLIGQRIIDGPIPRSLADLQTLVEPRLFRATGPEYADYLNTMLPPDDLTSQVSDDYLATTLEAPRRHDVNDLFRPPATSSNSGLPPRHLVVLDLNGSLLLRTKKRQDIGRYGKIYQMMRRPYVGCLAKYLAHEWTQNAVIIEHKSDEKVHHILPPDFDVAWFSQTPSSHNKKSKKKKKKKRIQSSAQPNPRLESLARLRREVGANPENFTLMCALDAMVWSSVQAHNLAPMIDAAFGVEQTALRACWTRKMLRLRDDGYHSKVQTTKNLETIWWSAEDAYTARSTLLMDDTVLKARLQPWNLLQIPEYTRPERVNHGPYDSVTIKNDEQPKEEEEEEAEPAQSDMTLLAVIGVLEELRNQSNIPAWIRGGNLLSPVHPPQQQKQEHNREPERDGGEGDGIAQEAVDAVEAEELWLSDPTVLTYWVKRGKSALASRGILVDVGLLDIRQDESFKSMRPFGY